MSTPLQGVRVLDLSQALSGPFAGMMLADGGADVIKVEPVGVGDHVREWLTTGADPVSPYFLTANRTTRSIAIDLKQDAGRALLLELAERSDVLLENFRPGAMNRLGLGYEAVRQRNPRLIYCSVSGFGQTGPLADRQAYDLIAAGYGGTMSVTGEAGGRYCKPGVPVADLTAGMSAAYSIVLALMQREHSGQGCHLDISLYDGLVSTMAQHLVAYQATGRLPQLSGSAHPQVAPYQTFRTGTTDINVAVLNERQWQVFCRVIEREDWLNDARFVRPGMRANHREELVSAIEAVFATRPAAEWLALLNDAGVPSGPINTAAELMTDPHLEARDMFLTIDRPGAKSVRIPAAPWRGPGVLEDWTPPPALGEHTSEILREVLALSDERITALREAGTVA